MIKCAYNGLKVRHNLIKKKQKNTENKNSLAGPVKIRKTARVTFEKFPKNLKLWVILKRFW